MLYLPEGLALDIRSRSLSPEAHTRLSCGMLKDSQNQKRVETDRTHEKEMVPIF